MAFCDAFCGYRQIRDKLASIPELTGMLLNVARATPRFFATRQSGLTLGAAYELLANLGTSHSPGAEALFDALTASGSTAVLTNMVEDIRLSLWNFVFEGLLSGSLDGSFGRRQLIMEDQCFRRAFVRLLEAPSVSSQWTPSPAPCPCGKPPTRGSHTPGRKTRSDIPGSMVPGDTSARPATTWVSK